MKALKAITTVCAVLALLGVTMSRAAADTFTFNKTDDVWHLEANWNPEGGPPDSDDTAVIPSGKKCRINAADEAAEVITVSGTLIINGYRLDLGNTSNNATTSTVDHRLEFKTSTSSYLRLRDNVTLTGTGTVTAAGEGGRLGCFSSVNDLTTGADLTFEGSLFIDINLESSATFVVETGDTMLFGPASAYTRDLTGNATLTVDGGTATFQRMDLNACSWDFILEGGEIALTLTSDPGIFNATEIDCTVSGGTLDIDDDFGAKALEFDDGTIEVAADVAAEFAP
ncbi:MAG: G8 domain-containing protein [Planctomycetes bacterium]|nr:G8 domain-containing protein [Planctomycetota bacterium]